MGLSTANQAWGPAETYPLILGNNAAGFPHVFVGTGAPLSLYVVRLHARVIYGKLSQTPYSSMPENSEGARRLASGIVASAQPRGITGLELGLARFFHSAWPARGIRWSDLRVPFEGVYKSSLISQPGVDDARNQLASLFFRWVMPHSGFEVYGEYGREDHSWDARDLALEPDHSAGYMLGLHKVWWSSPQRLLALRTELINLRLNTLTRNRDVGGGYYLNGALRQGHTQRGQLLGADVTAGSGAGATIALESYSRSGRWTVSWTRTLIDELATYFRTGVRPPHVPEVQHALTLDTLLFLGPLDLHAGLTPVVDTNRFFDGDRFNVNAVLGGRWNW
jgi:hypothetical protein